MPLGSAPFALATDARGPDDGRASWRSRAHPGARVYVLPCIAGHVGADAAGAILAETPYLADEVTLLVDVGTNAEIVLGNRDRLLAASSPTGPAFEGAQISLRPAGRARRDRAGPDRQGHPRASLPRHRLEPLVGRDRLRGVDAPDRRHRRLRLGDRRGDRRAVPRRRHHRRRHDRRVDSPPARRGSSPTAGRSPTCSTRAARRDLDGGVAELAPPDDHPERRPRDPAREGRALRGRATPDGPPRRRDGGPGQARRARSAARSTRSTRWSSASCRTRRWTGSARPATPPAPGRSSRSCRPRRATRSSGWSGRSRRSRPRSSRGSRSTSSTRWPSRTRPRPSEPRRTPSSCRAVGRPRPGRRRRQTRAERRPVAATTERWVNKRRTAAAATEER